MPKYKEFLLNISFNKLKQQLKKYYKIVVSLILLFIYFFFLPLNFSSNLINLNNEVSDIHYNNRVFDKTFDYIHYESNLITEKMKNNAGWQLELDEAELINGLIRKHKPKNILEIGVARGGSAILILNAIKDFSNSRLISIDLNTEFYLDKNKKTGYLVKEKFPELMDKWHLLVGRMPHIFLSKLNMKFDFLFLDTAHKSPGEFLNLIEVLPFLNENAIVILHDIVWHLLVAKEVGVKPTQVYLMSSLVGEKIYTLKNKRYFSNIGVVFLAKNQEHYYLNYFLLLMTKWHYLPTNEQLSGLRNFIIKYYEDKYLRIFDNSVEINKKFFKK